jgi:hypothetical protein
MEIMCLIWDQGPRNRAILTSTKILPTVFVLFCYFKAVIPISPFYSRILLTCESGCKFTREDGKHWYEEKGLKKSEPTMMTVYGESTYQSKTTNA